MSEYNEILSMTADTIGRDLLQALVQEIKLMPDVWQKLPETKQLDIIERLTKRVQTNVRMGVHLIASQGRTVVVGDLEGVTIKDGIKATFKISPANESRHELFDAVGKACLLVVADTTSHIGGMDEVKPDPDQRDLGLGGEEGEIVREYDGEPATIDAKALPAPNESEGGDE